MRTLQDDWDDCGASAPCPALVDSAVSFARDLKARGNQPADRVIASVNGTIYFEWYTPTEYREIEITAPNHAEYRSAPRRSL